MNNRNYDAIVLGAGGVGSATLYALAKRGIRALGIDFHPAAHDKGSSHGETRAIRQAYFEHPDYVPLAVAAYKLWRDLEAQSGESLMVLPGIVQAGPPDGEVVCGVLSAAREHNLVVEELTPADANNRFAPLHLADEHAVVYEPAGGYLLVEKCVRSHLALAESLGVELRFGERIVGWRSEGETVRVTTDKQTYCAAHLILALGAGSPALINCELQTQVIRKHQYWFSAAVTDGLHQLPVYLVEDGAEILYGFPVVSEIGMKAARHSGGQVLGVDPIVEQPKSDVSERADDQAQVEAFLRSAFPSIAFQCAQHSTCYYCVSADQHFYFGRHPECERVLLAAGLSGHGFKFSCVLGQTLAELALEGSTTHPVDFLSPRRVTG